ncbi:MAG TPA: hypothetical protein VFG62_05825 [Rhodopila sp.]|nr:hypothetical protein [Rhodopila sp.]
MLEEQIGRAKGLLDQATKATGIVNARAMVKAGAGMEDINAQGQNWDAAIVLVRQAAAELKASTELAASMKGAAAAKKKGDEAMVPAAVTIALKDLRKEVDIAKSTEHADIVPELFKTMETSLAAAQKAFDENKLGDAGEQLKIVGDALIKATIAQGEHKRFLETYAPLKLRETALTTSTVPVAAKIKDKTDPLVAALTTADEQDKAHKWDKAFEALRAAEIAADAAKEASDLRIAYDTKAKEVTDKANTLTDPVKGQVTDMVAKAEKAADEFNFAHAMRFLGNAEARGAGEDLKGLAKTTPLDMDEIGKAIDMMLAAIGGEELLAKSTDSKVQPRNPQQAGKRIPARGKKAPDGPELLDEIVKNFDDTVPVKVIIAIAKKRFGVDLKVSALGYNDTTGKLEETEKDGDFVEQDNLAQRSQRSKTARKLYETIAMTPEQTNRNPSLTSVERDEAFELVRNNNGTVTLKDKTGGFYSPSKNRGVMQGRPGVGDRQKFGKDIISKAGGPGLPPAPPKPWDEKTAKEQKELEVYEPASNAEVDYFEFANVHESGHAADDRLNFMASRLGNATFGNWLEHGGNYNAVAKPVSEHYAKLCKVADQAGVLQQFVSDTMVGNKPEVPAVDPAKQAGVTEACNKITNEWYPRANTKGTPWYNQGKCDMITMSDGRIYQEAYEGSWVSYPAAERKKGMTGYQFRAPGEWFAELFSAYHHEKLKPGHPARKWLSSLQL